MDKKRKKSVLGRVLLLLLLLLLAGCIVLAVTNCGNIKALYKGLTTDVDDIGQMLEQNTKETVGLLANLGINVSDEDFDKVNSGELNEEEIAAILLDGLNAGGEPVDVTSGAESTDSTENAAVPDAKENSSVSSVTETPSVPANTDSSGKGIAPPASSGTNTSETATVAPSTPVNTVPTVQAPLSEEEYNKKVADLVAKIYVIKANFVSTLSAFENKIISEYKALPDEQRTSATKAKIVSDNMSYVAGLEAQCDAQVKAVTDELTVLIQENGKDTALVDAINTAYAKEKELKKAYYISLYK
ncbi:MAG: hypothetical protein ACI4RV_00510 [Eubacteriales bacterium]